MNSPAWQAGHRAAFDADADAGLLAINPPTGLTEGERGDWISGFLCGIRDADDARLKVEFEEGAQS